MLQLSTPHFSSLVQSRRAAGRFPFEPKSVSAFSDFSRRTLKAISAFRSELISERSLVYLPSDHEWPLHNYYVPEIIFFESPSLNATQFDMAVFLLRFSPPHAMSPVYIAPITVLYRPSLHMGSGVTCFDQLFMTSKPNFWLDKVQISSEFPF